MQDIKPNLSDFLSNHPVIQGLDKEQLQTVICLMVLKDFHSGATIIGEGEMSDELYIIYNGKVKVNKFDEQHKNQLEIVELNKGDIFGDMSFMDGEPRSSSVIALEDTRVLLLRKQDLIALPENSANILSKILANLVKINVHRLRSSNQNYIASMIQAMKQLELRNQFGKLFVVIVGCLAIGSIHDVLVASKIIPEHSVINMWLFLLAVVAPTVFFLKKYHYSLKDYGLTTHNWQKALKEGFTIGIITAVIYFIVMVSYRYLMGIPQVFSDEIFTLGELTYIPHAFLQEFLMRGIVQTLLQNFLDDKKGFISIILSSILFSQSHLYGDPILFVLTFVLSISLGYIYLRHKNIIGVGIIHSILGFTTMGLGLL